MRSNVSRRAQSDQCLKCRHMVSFVISIQSTTAILLNTIPMEHLHAWRLTTAVSNDNNMVTAVVISGNGGSSWTYLRRGVRLHSWSEVQLCDKWRVLDNSISLYRRGEYNAIGSCTTTRAKCLGVRPKCLSAALLSLYPLERGRKACGSPCCLSVCLSVCVSFINNFWTNWYILWNSARMSCHWRWPRSHNF
jgi:hypothetical protein